MNIIDGIIAYEEGRLTEEEVIELFQALIDDGYAWTFPGRYGRMAESLIEAGLCHRPSSAKQEEGSDHDDE
ncbi:MAG TPA: hypothetical protein VNL98_07320 [Gemmatimonadales bacterium]|nr:hypothetical protein [Gemmatimonadales bacterium]